MTKTTKVVLIVTAVLVVCIIGAAATIGIMSARSGGFDLVGLFRSATVDLDEDAALDLDGVSKLNINNVSGKIIIQPGEPHATLTGRILTNTDQKTFLKTEKEDGTLTVKCDMDSVFPHYISGEIVLTVYVPEDMAIDTAVSGASASSQISGVRFGGLTVSSASGAVDINDCAGGALDINLSSGGINIGNLDFENANVTCVSGSVAVEKLSGAVSVNSTSGGVRVTDVAGAVDVRSISGDTEITLTQAEVPSVRADVTSGGIKLKLNPKAAFDLSARTTSGGFSTDFDVTMSGQMPNKAVGADVSGKVNGGGATVDLSTVSGGISVSKAK